MIENKCLSCDYYAREVSCVSIVGDCNLGNKWKLKKELKEVVVNDQGGKQSKTNYMFTDFAPEVMLRLAARSHMGYSEYGPKNYLKISSEDHINHALIHIFQYMTGKQNDGDELAGAVCRLMFVMEKDGLK